MEKVLTPFARLFMGHIFLLAGINKIGQYTGTQGYMESMGVPGELLPLVILLEIVGGLAVIVGWQVKWASLALAGFTIVSALIFHSNLGDQTQMIMFMKNWSIAGGLLLLAVHGAGQFSVQSYLARSHRQPSGHSGAHA
ncbi:MAG: DoxX family protein [Gammaproteobacteria bacterium]|jgi:putative oxidoreductase